jgi:hypothetical protein
MIFTIIIKHIKMQINNQRISTMLMDILILHILKTFQTYEIFELFLTMQIRWVDYFLK